MTLEPDDQGMIGRQCPQDDCGLYFKIRPGTGRDTESIRCPYCRAEGDPSSFFTKDQLDYAISVAARDIVGPMLPGVQERYRTHEPPPVRGIASAENSRWTTSPFQ